MCEADIKCCNQHKQCCRDLQSKINIQTMGVCLQVVGWTETLFGFKKPFLGRLRALLDQLETLSPESNCN